MQSQMGGGGMPGMPGMPKMPKGMENIDLTAGKGPKRKLAVCVLPVSHQLSLKKAAAAFGASKAAAAFLRLS